MGRYEDVEVKEDRPGRPKPDQPNKPMRAGEVILNEEVGAWLKEQLDLLFGTGDTEPVWDDLVADAKPTRILDELEKLGWTRYVDSYGDHAYVSTQYPASNPPRDTDELRLNVVLKKGVLYMDLRPWGWYENSGSGGRGRRY